MPFEPFTFFFSRVASFGTSFLSREHSRSKRFNAAVVVVRDADALNGNEKRDVIAFLKNRDLQNKILGKRSRQALNEFFIGQIRYLPALGKVYPELTNALLDFSLKQDASFAEGEAFDLLQRLELSRHDPLQAIKNIAYDSFRGHGIEIVIDADTKKSSFNFKQPTELTFSFDATDAGLTGREALERFREGLEGRQSVSFNLNQAPGVRLTVTPQVIAELLGLTDITHLEFKPQPTVIYQSIIYVVGEHQETIVTKLVIDWGVQELRLRPQTTQPDKFSAEIVLPFEETEDANEPLRFARQARFSTTFTYGDGTLPATTDLPLLRVLEKLSADPSIELRDADLGRTLYRLTVNATQNELRTSGIGFHYLRLCVEVNALLKVQGFNEDIQWPSLDSLTAETFEVLEMLAVALRGSVRPMSVTATLVEPSVEAANITFVNGHLDKAVTISQEVWRGDLPFLRVFVELREPRVELSRDGKLVHYSSLGQAFAESKEPLGIRFRSSEASGRVKKL